MKIAALRSVLTLAPVDWLEAIVNAAPNWGVSTPVRFAAFLGHLAHESSQFTHLEENLNYSAERLMAVWPKRFPTLERAKAYARAPEKLANCVYANRLGNGTEESGDGWWFRGRGPMQLTGHNNYKHYGEKIGTDLLAAPEKLLTPAIGAAAAAAFWQEHGLNELADEAGNDAGLVVTAALNAQEMHDEELVTRAINGGDLGLYQRVQWINKIRAVL